MSEFKVGDKVRAKRNTCYRNVGVEFVIKSISECWTYISSSYCVEPAYMEFAGDYELVYRIPSLEDYKELLEQFETNWEQHQKTKFLSDGSHFVADNKMNELYNKVKELLK